MQDLVEFALPFKFGPLVIPSVNWLSSEVKLVNGMAWMESDQHCHGYSEAEAASLAVATRKVPQLHCPVYGGLSAIFCRNCRYYYCDTARRPLPVVKIGQSLVTV